MSSSSHPDRRARDRSAVGTSTLVVLWDGIEVSAAPQCLGGDPDGTRLGGDPDGTRLVGGPDGTHGAVWGLVTPQEAEELVVSASRGQRAGQLPDRPWLVVSRHGAELTVSCSTMLPSGAFWGVDQRQRLVVASDPLAVARAVGGVAIDEGFVHDYLFAEPPARRTAFCGVRRLEPGFWFTWSSPTDAPKWQPWCGPEVWPEPHLTGAAAVEKYLEVFDRVVEGALPLIGRRPVLGLSAGLDSTFVAASVGRARPAAQPLALHSAPLRVEGLQAFRGRDVDESELAQRMAQLGGFEFRRVVNDKLTQPLDAAAVAQRKSGVPTWATANQIWLNEFDRIAAAEGATAWLTGWHGNASFSYDHPYAEEYYARQMRLPTVLGLRTGTWSQKGHRLGATVKQIARRKPPMLQATMDHLPGVPPRRVPTSSEKGRDRWLQWLAFRNRGLAAARNPAAGGGVVCVDPFAAPSVLAVAAAITPAEWCSPGFRRAFARRAGEGRVPDEIRLRTRRGQQSSDAWFAIRDQREAYLDRIAGVSDLPGLGDVDERTLTRHVESWPWGELHGPPRREYVTLDRLLAMAGFIRQFSQESV